MKYIEIDGPDRVYFIRMRDLIKIGYTAALKQRLSSIGDTMPYPIELLHDVPGDRFSEAWHHWRFDHLRVKGEWFKDDPELLDYIKSLKEQTKIPGEARGTYIVDRIS